MLLRSLLASSCEQTLQGCSSSLGASLARAFLSTPLQPATASRTPASPSPSADATAPGGDLGLCGASPPQPEPWQLRQQPCSTSYSSGFVPDRTTGSWEHWRLQHVRGFAAKAAGRPAAGGAGGKAEDQLSPMMKRRGSKKLYSARNDRVRAMFDQIWPTVQLSEEEAGLFRKNSRVFVTELGRSISLKAKFAVAKAADIGGGVPHQDAKALLYESDLHLDAVGEHPRYLKIRKLRAGNYATKLQALRKLRLLLGFVRRYSLQRLYEFSLLQPGPDRMWKLVCAMEGGLVLSALRSGLAHDSIAAKGMVNRGSLWLNGTRPTMPNVGLIQPGDVLHPAARSTGWYRQYVGSQMGLQLMREVAADWSGPGPFGPLQREQQPQQSVAAARAEAQMGGRGRAFR